MKKFNIHIATIFISVLLFNSCCNEKVNEVNTANIEKEIKEFYSMLDGPLAEKSVEEWDNYFLKSPNIGNIHENHPQIGWETFHKQIVKMFSGNLEGNMSVSELQIYPIDSKLIWVSALWTWEFPDGVVLKSRFYDTLIKTDDGWRVVVSVVNDEKP